MSETICARAAALETALWEESIPIEDLDALRAHAADCAECTSVLEGIRSARHGLNVFAEEAAPVPDVDRAWAAVSPRLTAARFPISSRTLALAASLLVVAGGVWTWSSRIGGLSGAESISLPESRLMNSSEQVPRDYSALAEDAAKSPASEHSIQMAREAMAGADEERLAGTGLRPGGAPGEVTIYNASAPSPEPGPRHVERAASLGLYVADARAAYKRVTGLVAEAGGVIVSSRIEQASAAAPAEAVSSLRIPIARFDGFLGDLRGLGEIASETIRGDDRTNGVRDLEGRIRDKDAAIEALRNRLARNPQADEIARIEAELASARSERDALETSRRELAGRTDFATIELRLSEQKLEPRGGMIYWELFTGRFGESLGTATGLFSWGLSALVVVAGAVLPWTIVIIPAWIAIKRRVYAW